MQAIPGQYASAASFDGSVIVGYNGQAFRFTSLGGILPLGGFVVGSNGYSTAYSVSSDGLTVVGTSLSPTTVSLSYEYQAFRWTPASLMVGLGHLPGTATPTTPRQSNAYAISANGTVAVGDSTWTGGVQAIRWTQVAGMQGLGVVPGTNRSTAHAVSGDGTVIVGTAAGPSIDTAFVWTAATGMRELRTVLESQAGLWLTGWTLYDATGISADGLTIVGNGVDPCGTRVAWIAHLDSDRACPSDFNNSGGLSVQDIFDFLNGWFAGDARADFNGCGGLAVQDIFDFLNAWFVGCP